MIFGHINDLESGFTWLPKPLMLALRHLKQSDFTTMAAGPYELQGRDIHVNVMDVTTKPFYSARPETHRDYLDIQYLVTGRERIGVAFDAVENVVTEDLLDSRDVRFFGDVSNESILTMTPGSFALLFPSDVHRPTCAMDQPMAIRKVVVKVRVALLDD